MKVNWPILVTGVAGTLLLVALLATGFFFDSTTAVVDVRTGGPAPTFRLVDIDGKEWSLEELKGKPVFINFWSTWCLPCKQEHPMLLQAARAYPEVQFLGLIYNDDANKVRSQMGAGQYRMLMDDLASAGITYPNLEDPSGQVALEYGVVGVPESFFVDTSGQITYKQVGPLQPSIARQELDRIAQRKSP